VSTAAHLKGLLESITTTVSLQKPHMWQEACYVPGMRIALRDVEWCIDRIDIPSRGDRLLTCVGQSELVQG